MPLLFPWCLAQRRLLLSPTSPCPKVKGLGALPQWSLSGVREALLATGKLGEHAFRRSPSSVLHAR
jgi:hypothetical protein